MISAHALAKLSEAAYDETPTISVAGVEVVVTETEAEVVFAVRGTERDFADILTDLRGVPWSGGDLGWVHSGFFKRTRKAWPVIEGAIRDVAQRSRTFTGHSKGGAEASLLAAMAVLAGYKVEALVTFGCPRVGYARLGEVLASVSAWRYVRGRDAVPSHPSSWWGYQHHGIEVPIGKPGNRWTDHKIAGYVEDLS